MKPDPAPPIRRESFNEDAAGTTAEMAAQPGPSRSTKQLTVRPVPSKMVQPLIVGQHYLHSMPAVTVASYGVYQSGELVGAVVLTAGSINAHRLLVAARPGDVVTLARLWLSDNLPTNSESRVLAFVLRDLERTGSWKAIVTFADPLAGHVGTIYQATNWLYLGLADPTGYLDLGTGQLRHPRTVGNLLGSQCVPHLRRTGIPARRVRTPGKHRYLYLLDPAWRWRVRVPVLPYPERHSRGPP